MPKKEEKTPVWKEVREAIGGLIETVKFAIGRKEEKKEEKEEIKDNNPKHNYPDGIMVR